MVSARDKKTIEENREQFSACLMVTLPQLMTKVLCLKCLESLRYNYMIDLSKPLQKAYQAKALSIRSRMMLVSAS